MPVQVNIGLNRKVGEPNYGSRGASVHLQVELDSAVVDEPDRLRTQIHRLFALARRSLEEELHGSSGTGQTSTDHSPRPGSNAHGQSTEVSHAQIDAHKLSPPPKRRATLNQIRALNTIATRQQIDLPEMLKTYGVRYINDLSIGDASQLIDLLKRHPPSRAVAS